MATVRFRIKGKEPSKPTSIYVRFRGNKDIEKKTNLLIKPIQWSASKGQMKTTSETGSIVNEFNLKLRELKNNIINTYNQDYTEGIEINSKWLAKIIDLTFSQHSSLDEDELKSVYFIPYITDFITRAPKRKNPKTGKILSRRTIQDYEGTLRKIKHLEELSYNRRLKHTDINLELRQKFINYCEEVRDLKPKTIGGDISNIKLFLKSAEIEGFKVSQDYRHSEFSAPNNTTDDFALNEREIQQLFDVELNSDRLLNARNWFIICLWTGLRVSDLLSLTKEHLIDGFIQIPNIKTGIYTIIPLHEQVQKTLDQNEGDFPRKISATKFNEYIKEVCKEAGFTEQIKGSKQVPTEYIDYDGKKKKANRKKSGIFPKYELISSHIGRRTFCTIHYGKIDTLTIMRISGHATERQFIDYVKIPPKTHAIKMRELWTKMK
jgi:integrase